MGKPLKAEEIFYRAVAETQTRRSLVDGLKVSFWIKEYKEKCYKSYKRAVSKRCSRYPCYDLLKQVA